MDEIVCQLDEVENVKYEKLQEIKEKNENLLLIQNHILHLQRENKEIKIKITKNEFSLLE